MSDPAIFVAPPRIDVPIFQGDDAVRVEEARRRYIRAAQQQQFGGTPLRVGDQTPVAQAAAERDEILAEATPRAVVATVQAIGRRHYRRLRTAHPPRKDNLEDAAAGFNVEDMGNALMELFDDSDGRVVKTLIRPVFDTKTELMAWLDTLTDGNFEQLFDAAVTANEGGSPDPKALLSEPGEPSTTAT